MARQYLGLHAARRFGYGGYTFFDSEYNKVGGAASTMHSGTKAQKKANELGVPVAVYLEQAALWHFCGVHNPKGIVNEKVPI